MARKNSTKKVKKGEKREKGERIRIVYAFNAERAKAVREERYKGKTSMLAAALNALIAGRKEGYTKPEMLELLKAEMGSKYTTGFPMKFLKAEKVIKSSKEKRSAAAAPTEKTKKARKARKSKANGAARVERAIERAEREAERSETAQENF